MVKIADAKKCCFCLPLRRGLLAVGYFKVASSIGFTLFMVFFTMLLVYYRILETFILTFIVILYVMVIFDLTFDIMFIVSAHRKNHKYLRIYIIYLVTQLIGYLMLLIIYVVWMLLAIEYTDEVLLFILGGVGVILSIMALHTYFIYLVRSEMRKLQLSALFRFKNHVDEPECSAQIVG